jgi:hypothetical protein
MSTKAPVLMVWMVKMKSATSPAMQMANPVVLFIVSCQFELPAGNRRLVAVIDRVQQRIFIAEDAHAWAIMPDIATLDVVGFVVLALVGALSHCHSPL